MTIQAHRWNGAGPSSALRGRWISFDVPHGALAADRWSADQACTAALGPAIVWKLS